MQADPTRPSGDGRRRAALALLVAGAAGGAGMAWRWRQELAAEATPPAAGLAEAGGLWTLRLDRPDGRVLELSALRGRPLVLNFWATWCPPCIEELPELDRFHRSWAPRGWEVVGLAVDRPSAVREFLARQPLGFAVAMAGMGGTELSRALGNDSGALPYTAVFDRHGALRQRKAGRTTLVELEAFASKIH